MLRIPGIACKASALVMASLSCLGVNADEEKKEKRPVVDGFLNIKLAHERSNNYCFGPKNTSGIAISPFIQIKNFSIEADLSYGRVQKYSRALMALPNQTEFVGDVGALAEAYANDPDLLKPLNRGYNNCLGKAHFYRNYTRALYVNEKHDFKVLLGDTAVRNTIGFQKIISGAGISIFRQGGNGSTVNPGLPIVVTRASIAEVRLNGEIIARNILRPGVYTIDQIAPETLLPSAQVKIKDQLSCSEMFTVDYFSGYGMPEVGKDDFDLTVVCPSKYDLDDPYRMRYSKKPRLSGNYRRTFKEGVTYTLGTQACESSLSLDAGLIFNTKFGKIAPNVGYSNTRRNPIKNAAAASLYYALPENKAGIFVETLFSVMAKGYGDLGISDDNVRTYNEYINKYFTADQALHDQLLNSSDSGSSRQILARIYTKPIWNITPAFTFKGAWVTRTQRTRDYTIAFMTRIFDKCNITLSGGLTYDDPSKGYNRKSPDRRLLVACAIDLNSEWSTEYTYGQYYDEMRNNYGSLTYKPEAIKGLELCAEYVRKPGLSVPVFSVTYDCKYFESKIEQSTADTYVDKGSSMRAKSHSNDQLVLFGTNFSRKGIRTHKKMNINVVRTLDDYDDSKK